MSLSGVVSLLQYPCFALVKGALRGDPLYVSNGASVSVRHERSMISSLKIMLVFFLQVNIAMTMLTLLAFIHPINVYIQCRKSGREHKDGQGTVLEEAKF